MVNRYKCMIQIQASLLELKVGAQQHGAIQIKQTGYPL